MSNLLSRNRLRLDHSPVETLRQTSTSIVPLLAQYHLMPQFLAESVIDRAIASIHCTVTEASEACQQLYQQFGLLTEEQQQTWRSHYGFTPYQVEQIATRSQRIDRFKQTMWEPGLESYFLTHKDRLDRVVYSLLRTQQPDMLHELFFRIQDGEHSFGELARQYSEGPEAATGGLCGPVELGTLNLDLAQLLRILPIGVVQPIRIDEWQVLVRLEQRIPAQLDEIMRQRLLQEQFEAWFQTQIAQLPAADQVWLGSAPV
jgi:parvulin-like peptidyl-prolyl isomerase